MKTAQQVADLITQLKASGIPLAEVAWKTALACVGWPYIFGDRGEYCTPAHRRAAYASKGADHPTIKTKCKNFEGTGSCSGCTFYPGGKTRAFDCRGFTYWVLLQIYGWKLMGAGATSQWNTAANWKAKGTVAEGLPADTLVCLFVQKGKTMEHTGFGLNNETIECSNGVQHFTQRKAKWTHWGVPACVDGTIPTPTPEPTPTPSTKPTLKRGSKGAYVIEMQTELSKLGYDLGPCGIDGDFGRATEKAVKAFQGDHGLKVDGICGPATWAALDAAVAALTVPESSVSTYSVIIPGLDITQAKRLVENYPGAEIVKGEDGK